MAKVVVLGSLNIDLIVSTVRLPEPGETVKGECIANELGGKGANQAVAAARAGAAASFVGVVGDDDQGAAMLARLQEFGVDASAVTRTAGQTGCALVVTCSEDNQIVIIPGANARVDASLADKVALSEGDICVAQLETSVEASRRLFEQARTVGARSILNAAPADAGAMGLIPLVDVLIVNESECRLLAAMPEAVFSDDATLLLARDRLGLASGQALIATLGPDGVAIACADGVVRVRGEKVEVVDTTGAGDCFCGYFAAGLAQGKALEEAASLANIAASLAVQSRGAACSVPQYSAVEALVTARRR